MMKKTKMTSCIEKLTILLVVGICLSACIGCVGADEEIHKQEMVDPTNSGVIYVYCNVENATVIVNYHFSSAHYHSERTVSNGYAIIGIGVNYIIDSLNVTADGYYPQNFTTTEIPMPSKKGETVSMEVTLKPISASSPFHLFSLVGGIGVAAALYLRCKKGY